MYPLNALKIYWLMNAFKLFLALTAALTLNTMMAQSTEGLLSDGSVTTAATQPSAKSSDLTMNVTVIKDMKGQVKRGKLNRQLRRTLNEALDANSASLGLWGHDRNGYGVLVSGVGKGTNAQAAGLKEGDLIVSIDEYSVYNLESLADALGHYRPNEVATVHYVRDLVDESAEVRLVPRNLAKFHALMWPGDGIAKTTGKSISKKDILH